MCIALAHRIVCLSAALVHSLVSRISEDKAEKRPLPEIWKLLPVREHQSLASPDHLELSRCSRTTIAISPSLHGQ